MKILKLILITSASIFTSGAIASKLAYILFGALHPILVTICYLILFFSFIPLFKKLFYFGFFGKFCSQKCWDSKDLGK